MLQHFEYKYERPTESSISLLEFAHIAEGHFNSPADVWHCLPGCHKVCDYVPDAYKTMTKHKVVTVCNYCPL